ncbi:(d)CMP kinase [Priestia taiwanensis]|uniref:Cytidylate kinase n=1 Tax=Priestia taiwanensis TaxID=1347902 RepID=A0A917AJB1_9BACI|nr:(d)CMP kinase [Priestia taiwanensis]MBM7361673.1 cytidylate kinase [Priestia taiwanensis]GGE56093.1 cytidylate kinase [Priestia taiwanensis]
MNNISIAIDGPAASGKSTVAKVIAKRLGYLYIDTGAMYRALTYKALENNVDVENESALMHLLEETDMQLKHGEDGQLMFVDGEDVSEAIRSPKVTNSVSHVAKHGLIREDMVKRQREFSLNGGVIMDGRDIGTHVLPHAEVKIFMLASVEERAQRRHLENMQKGFPSDFEKLKEEIALRDKIDSEREVAPLKKADDAIEFDTTLYSKEEVVEKMLDIIQSTMQK